MKKQTIAVDIDDVLASSAAGWVAYSNKKWGTNLTVEDYLEDWSTMWRLDHQAMVKRARHLHSTGVVATFDPFVEAKAVLTGLAKRYKMVITSSRNSLTRDDTLAWLNEHFNNIFAEIHLTGFFDAGIEGAIHRTKADLLTEVGANYLIDDQPKHCLAAAEVGILAVLFGDYAWNQDIGELPAGVARAHNWQEVQEYFDGIRQAA